AHNLAGKLDLEELAALLHSARLYVSVPTGPMHLAAAVGTPVVALYGPEELAADRVRFAPYAGGLAPCTREPGAGSKGPHHAAVCSPAACDCPAMRACRTATCMRAITPGAVFIAAVRLIGACPAPREVTSAAQPPFRALRIC